MSSNNSNDAPPPPGAGHNTTNTNTLSIQERANNLFLNTEILAPMVRASTTPLRTLALQYGADLVYTEEIVDRSILTTHRVVNDQLGTIDYIKNLNEFSPKVQRRMKLANSIPIILRIDPNLEDGKLIYQMGTGEANLAIQAATLVERDVNGIDINMGCPKKFSVSGGMGSALLSDVDRACDIIKVLRRNLHCPISAKIRLLKDTKTTVEFVKALVQAGANAITIHGREVGDESTEPAKWDRLTEVVQILKRTEMVPIIINGDLYTRQDMERMKLKTGADGVMLARPALYNVSLFRKPPPTPPSDGEQVTEKKDDEQTNNQQHPHYSYSSPLLLSKTQVVQEYISHAVRYDTNHKNVKYVVCEMMSNRRHPTPVTPHLDQNYEGGQSIDKVCKCKSLDDLCKLWDVTMSSAVGNKKVRASEAAVMEEGDRQSQPQKEKQQQQQPAGEHRYDDAYFLDPEKFRTKGNDGRVRPQGERDEEKKDPYGNLKNDDNGKEEEEEDGQQKQSSQNGDNRKKQPPTPFGGGGDSSAGMDGGGGGAVKRPRVD